MFMNDYFLDKYKYEIHYPSWFMAEKYYNCDNMYNIIKKLKIRFL